MENPTFGVEAFDMEDLPKIKVSFEKNGFAVVKNVFSASEVEEMREEMMRIIEAMEPEEHPRCVFTTYDEEKVIKERKTVFHCERKRNHKNSEIRALKRNSEKIGILKLKLF